MAATATTKIPTYKTYNQPVYVCIGVDPHDKKKLKVSPEPFWVHPNEEVTWICGLPHANHDKNCFTVKFKNESPFNDPQFHGHESHTGTPVVLPNLHKLYDYSITAPGFEPLDPQGGVRP